MDIVIQQWWDNLASARKTQICDTNTQLVGHVRRWETLKEEEIEELYDITIKQENSKKTFDEVVEIFAKNDIYCQNKGILAITTQGRIEEIKEKATVQEIWDEWAYHTE